MTIAAILSTKGDEVATVPSGAQVRDAVSMLANRKIGAVPVLGDEALPVVEIVPKSGAYDFEAKYVPGATEEIVPARISKPASAKAQEFALKAHRILGCTGATRTDMIVRGEEVLVLEINTIPGFTSMSVYPRLWDASGVPYAELIDRLIALALERSEDEARNRTEYER